eukprot:5390030-Prymnesium_polylepis.1
MVVSSPQARDMSLHRSHSTSSIAQSSRGTNSRKRTETTNTSAGRAAVRGPARSPPPVISVTVNLADVVKRARVHLLSRIPVMVTWR